MTPDRVQAFLLGQYKLQPSDWCAGEHLVFMDFIAPHGHAMALYGQLRRAFKGIPVHDVPSAVWVRFAKGNKIVSGYIGTKMVDATKAYQKENGLKVDGQINPGGPTEASLFGEKKGQVKTPTSTPLGGVSINKKMDNSRAANAERDKADENSNVGIYTGWDKTKIDENELLEDDNAKGLLSPSVKALFSFVAGPQKEKKQERYIGGTRW
jgi:peptidoglycan hydrolase-like protein with peptidoglycan-binding domain